MLARNSVLARLANSASSLASRNAASASFRSVISSVSSRMRSRTRNSSSSWAFRSSSSTRSRWIITVAISRAMALNAEPNSWNSVGLKEGCWRTLASRLPPLISRAARTTASTGRTSKPDRNQPSTPATRRLMKIRVSATRCTSPARSSSSSRGCATITPQPVLGTVV